MMDDRAARSRTAAAADTAPAGANSHRDLSLFAFDNCIAAPTISSRQTANVSIGATAIDDDGALVARPCWQASVRREAIDHPSRRRHQDECAATCRCRAVSPMPPAPREVFSQLPLGRDRSPCSASR
jgi:hypothetical protein